MKLRIGVRDCAVRIAGRTAILAVVAIRIGLRAIALRVRSSGVEAILAQCVEQRLLRRQHRLSIQRSHFGRGLRLLHRPLGLGC